MASCSSKPGSGRRRQTGVCILSETHAVPDRQSKAPARMPDVTIRNFKPSESVGPAGGSGLRRTAYGIAIGETFGSVGSARAAIEVQPDGNPGCCSARSLDADQRGKVLIRSDSGGSNDDAKQHLGLARRPPSRPRRPDRGPYASSRMPCSIPTKVGSFTRQRRCPEPMLSHRQESREALRGVRSRVSRSGPGPRPTDPEQPMRTSETLLLDFIRQSPQFPHPRQPAQIRLDAAALPPALGRHPRRRRASGRARALPRTRHVRRRRRSPQRPLGALSGL